MQAAVTFPAIWLESRPIRIHNSSPASKLSPKPNSFLDCTFHQAETIGMSIVLNKIHGGS
jgi:hypothetical protein